MSRLVVITGATELKFMPISPEWAFQKIVLSQVFSIVPNGIKHLTLLPCGQGAGQIIGVAVEVYRGMRTEHPSVGSFCGASTLSFLLIFYTGC